MALSKTEREEFAARRRIVGQRRRAPRPTDRPAGTRTGRAHKLSLITAAGSRKHRLIDAAGHVSLMAERVEPSVRYVAVDGPVTRIEAGTDEQLVEMTRRYLAPEKVEPYLEFARREHGESVAMYMQPQHWLSADLGTI